MRILRYFFYTIIIFIIILIPFYGAARLILPDYIKKEIIKSLPEGSSLSIGSVNTKADLRIVFENINYISPINNINLLLPKLEILPQFSFNRPIKILATELNYKSINASGKVKELQAEIFFNNNENSQLDLSGKIKEIESSNLIEFSQLKFLLEGVNKKNKFINFYVNKISFNFKNEYGYFGFTGDDFEGDTVLNENISLNLNIKNLDINLKEIFPINENRVLFSKNGQLTLKVFRDNENWLAPINFKLEKPSSPINDIGEKITVSTVANWSKSDSNCKWVDLFNQNNQCGILRDFLNTNISLKDDSGGVILIEGNGTCVTPSSNCPQRIDAEIKSRKTTQIFSKIMVSGVVNPLLGGVLLSGLLTSPTEEGETFDHKLNFKMIGAQILLNDKPLL